MSETKKSEHEILPDSYKYIAELIGPEKAFIILKHFGGSTIYIPKIDSYTRYTRNLEIVEAYKSGMTYSQLASQHGLTCVTIRNIISSCCL